MAQETMTVRRQWNDWRQANVMLTNLEALHWSSISGGVQALTPRPFLHGYIWCNQILEGELPHTCMHGTAPHRIKVCVVKKDNPKEIFEKLLSQLEAA